MQGGYHAGGKLRKGPGEVGRRGEEEEDAVNLKSSKG